MLDIQITDDDLDAMLNAEAKRIVATMALRLLMERAAIQAYAEEPRVKQALRSLVRQMLNTRLEHAITTETSRSVAFAPRILTAQANALDKIGAALKRPRAGDQIPPEPLDPENPTEAEQAAGEGANELYRAALAASNELELQPFRAALGDELEAALDAVMGRSDGVLKGIFDEVKADLADEADIEPADLLRRQS